MKISGQTKVYQVINENMEAIEVIASLNSHFKKLRNPVLRKLLAPRVNIAEAAKIGKVEVEVMLEKLAEIGFEIDDSASAVDVAVDYAAQKEAAEKFIDGREIKTMDVRPFLERGDDPLKIIQKLLREIRDDQVLEILITFEPVPLIKVQERFGYISLTTVDENDLYHTYFKRGENMEPIPETVLQYVTEVGKEEYEKAVANFSGELITIDVRDLQMPEPMVTILEAIEENKRKSNVGLKIFHKRVPQFLIPELEKKRMKTLVYPIEEGNVMLFITK